MRSSSVFSLSKNYNRLTEGHGNATTDGAYAITTATWSDYRLTDHSTVISQNYVDFAAVRGTTRFPTYATGHHKGSRAKSTPSDRTRGLTLYSPTSYFLRANLYYGASSYLTGDFRCHNFCTTCPSYRSLNHDFRS